MSRAEKLMFFEDLVNDVLFDEAVPPVDFKEVKDLKNDEGEPKKGFYKDGVVSVDQDHLDNGSLDDVADTAFHEAKHALNDWNEWPDADDLDPDPFGPGRYTTEEGIYIDQKGTLRDLLDTDEFPLTDEEKQELSDLEERDAEMFAEERLNQEREKCKDKPDSESSSKNPIPDGDWKLPPKEAPVV